MKSLDCLERLDPSPKSKSPDANVGVGQDQSHAVEEVDDETASKIEALGKSGRSRTEIQRLRIKALMRRAKARTELGGWSNLQGASEGWCTWFDLLIHPTDSTLRLHTALNNGSALDH